MTVKTRSKILVVDDEPLNVDLLEAHLCMAYDVVTASSGEEAIEKVKAEKPDIILLDIMMPGMDGYEVSKRLKSDPDTRFIPIILVTALSEVSDQVVPYLATQFGASRIGFRTAAGGVIADGRVVPEIASGTFEAVRSPIHGPEGTDVTGGMPGKVRELFGIDIDSYIFSAVKPGMIAGFLSEEPGMRITKAENRPIVDMLETFPIPTDSGRD